MDGEVTRSEPHGGADAARDPWWLGYVRPKGNIPPTALLALLMLACVPLVMVLCRVLAFPGVEPIATIGFDSLREFGQTLNESLSLAWVPAGERDTILYLLLLPTGALLIVLARLTFGLRVLGLRAILIGIGIQEAGLLPSLMLIAVVVGVIVAVRPSLRRIRLPMYARVAVVLSLAAMIMVGGLLVGPWVHSQAVWNVAFFPVIIVAMLAESIAKTLARDNVLTAVWRASWTILLALLIALIGQTTAVGEFVLRFPEILVSELVAIVLIAEFLDLRLLEEWPARLTRLVEGTRPWYTDKPRVAVVRNRWSTGVIGRLGNPAPAKYRKRSVQQVVDALRDLGFRVKVIEA
ncbi:MAG: 7TM domain-containing protein, partial [Woeseiaceae bacterium]